MRIRIGLVLGVLLAVMLAGCSKSNGSSGVATARSGPAASGSATPKLSDQEKALKFGQCMRDNGVPNFPDPKFDEHGDMGLDQPEGVDPKKMDAAQQKCKQYLPGGGQPKKADPQRVEQLRKFAQCMRDNGFPNYPDPNPDGSLTLDNNKVDPNDPKFTAAQNKCQQYMPTPPQGDAGGGSNSSGG
jgi:hypothetical protein